MKFYHAVFAALLLLPLAGGLQAQGFNDEFDGPALDPRWTWFRESPPNWMLWNGMLEITTKRGALNGTQFNNVRNMLLQGAPGQTFWCETRVHFRPTFVFHNAGLLYYVDDDNYIRVSRGILENHNGLWMEYEVDGMTEFLHVDDVIEDVVYLRLSRYNNTLFTASYSLDGMNWYMIARKELPLESTQPYIGLQAANGDGLGARGDDRPAQFDYFRVHLTTDVGAMPAAAPEAFRVVDYFPNPLTAGEQAKVLVELGETRTVRLAVYDMLGKMRWSGSPQRLDAGKHELRIESAGLQPGTYLIYLTAGDIHASRRVTIMK